MVYIRLHRDNLCLNFGCCAKVASLFIVLRSFNALASVQGAPDAFKSSGKIYCVRSIVKVTLRSDPKCSLGEEWELEIQNCIERHNRDHWLIRVDRS